MKILLLLCTLGLISSTVVTDQMLQDLQKRASFKVYSSVSEYPFKNTDQLSATLGLNSDSLEDTSDMPDDDDEVQTNDFIPYEFDSRQKWPNCVKLPNNQGSCGSCWAFASTSVLSDRFCIASNGKVNIRLSPQHLVSCVDLALGCHGGLPPITWTYLSFWGVVTEQCRPYTSSGGNVEKCNKKECANPNVQFKKYKAKYFYPLLTINQIKKDIMKNGPVETGFLVFDDFYFYRGGIYTKTKGAKLEGAHAVKIVGWGKEDGVDYWIVANSWGSSWGERGYFRIKFRECFFENVITGKPQFDDDEDE